MLDNDYETRRRFWYAIATLLFLLGVVLVVRQVTEHHYAEALFAERYWVSDVDLDMWPDTGAEWVNTEGTHRCTGTYTDGNLTVRYCRPILPPAPAPAR